MIVQALDCEGAAAKVALRFSAHRLRWAGRLRSSVRERKLPGLWSGHALKRMTTFAIALHGMPR